LDRSGSQRAAPARGAGKESPVSGVAKKPAEQSALKAKFEKARILWDDENGRRVLEAHFKEATISQVDGDATAELYGVQADLYRNGKVASSLTAPRVVADTRSKEVRASGGVKIISEGEDATVLSERLVWKSDEDKIVGEGAVKLTKGNISVRAQKFEADTALKKAKFYDGKASLD